MNLKIIDFGLALEMTKVDSHAKNFILGTPIFMSPEIFNEKGSINSYKEPVDIWACGVMMY